MRIYTSNSGDYDKVRTDIEDMQGPDIFTDSRLKSKAVKILGHLYINEEVSLWCDSNIYLKSIEPFKKRFRELRHYCF